MSDLHLFHGPNAGYALELYDRYRQDPTSVDAETRAFFDSHPADVLALAAEGAVTGRTNTAMPSRTEPSPEASAPCFDESKTIRLAAAAARLARFIRQRGHLEAHVDPLGLTPPGNAGLELHEHKLTAKELETLPSSVVGGPIGRTTSNAREAIERLRQVYSGTIGYDDEHIESSEERYWLRDSTESGAFLPRLTPDEKTDLLERLTEVETFERYIHSTFKGSKRFSIEGTDMLVPVLDEIIRLAAENGTRDVVMGMAHRGRLNVLAHVLGKPYANILVGFETQTRDESASVAGRSGRGYPGDVKYHLGFRRAYKESGIREMPITLVPNPSHLEFVNPVVEGHTRAAQEDRTHRGEPERDVRSALPIAIHGDAAFPGQGVVAETLNMTNLTGYRTGGTIHIIVNNQIGFTTLPSDGRSTLYASDLAKGFEIPIVHVNADDPLACIAAARMAQAYRERFHKDFLIDLIGYRRYGHNEGDAPELTQPRMYEVIEAHPTVRELWADQLQKEGLVSEEQATAFITTVKERLMAARKQTPSDHAGAGTEATLPPSLRSVETALPAEKLNELNTALLTWPEGLQVNPKLERVFTRWRAGLQTEGGIEWGQAETLAFASILADGTPIRLTGQDSERGTFGHRNLVLHDTVTGERYVPLQSISAARAAFAVYNSPLSENAAMGFEYGYCINAPGVLTLWEGQFGDFANGAQVIIDQFLTAGYAKWKQSPSLILLLPHGYEGSGPEHSSARLERFLQLAANDNIRVVNCTSPAQYFHLLRRQAALLESDPRPLIVMTPKSLLRHPRAGSSLADMTQGTFQPVIDDAAAQSRAEQITRLVLCSGKVYVDLTGTEAYAQADRVATVRVEQLYPLPAEELKKVIAGYPNLREVVWLQEEPRNMGAWSFIAPRLSEQVEWHGELRYVGRAEGASPAEGSMAAHTAEQNRLLSAALENAPEALAVSSSLEEWGLSARHARK